MLLLLFYLFIYFFFVWWEIAWRNVAQLYSRAIGFENFISISMSNFKQLNKKFFDNAFITFYYKLLKLLCLQTTAERSEAPLLDLAKYIYYGIFSPVSMKFISSYSRVPPHLTSSWYCRWYVNCRVKIHRLLIIQSLQFSTSKWGDIFIACSQAYYE